MDAARGRHARRQESHVLVAAICVTIDLVGSGALEHVIRVVGVAELALMLPYLTSADEIVAMGDVHQQIGLLRQAGVADVEIGAAVALTREYPLVSGGETSVVANALQRPQDMVVRAGPIRSMMDAGVDVVPAPSPPESSKKSNNSDAREYSETSSNDGARRPRTKPFGLGREVPLAAAWHIRKRSEGKVVGEPEELMEEGNIVLLRDWLSGARRIAAVCRPNLQKRATTLNYLPGLNARRGRGVRGQSGPTLTRQGRKRDVVACRSPRGTTVGTNPSKKKTAQTL